MQSKNPASTVYVNKSDYFADSSSVAFFHFENNVSDTFGNFDGTPNSATFVNGKFGRAVYLGDGKNIFIPRVLINPTSATFSFWVYPLTAADSVSFLGFNVPTWDNSYQRGFGLYYDFIAQNYADGTVTANDSFHLYNAGNLNSDKAQNISSTAITKNSWNHVVFVFSQPNFTVYVNGVDQGSVTHPEWTYLANFVTTSSDWVIGDTVYTTNSSDAYFDQIRFFNRALNASEVQQLYSRP